MRFSAVVLLVAAAGCGASGEDRAPEYFPDMTRGPAYKAFAPNPATHDGLTLQRPMAGTIARGYHPFHYGPGEAEAVRAGRELTNPFHPTPQILDEGQALYQTYCMICHGAEGKGDGTLVGKIPPPPSYKSARVLAFPPGRIFHVVTTGSGKMQPYSTQLSSDERWKVVTYVTSVLQALGGGYAPPSGGVGGTP
jgi:mono/diheme cytochrome c family protein